MTLYRRKAARSGGRDTTLEGTPVEPRRFDSLTRSLASPKTRRGLLGSLTALGAGLLGAQVADAQVTQALCGNVVCGSNPGICNPGCVCCTYSNGNSRCMPPNKCTAPGTVAATTTTPAPPPSCETVACQEGVDIPEGSCMCNSICCPVGCRCKSNIAPLCLLAAGRLGFCDPSAPACLPGLQCDANGNCVPAPCGSGGTCPMGSSCFAEGCLPLCG